MQFNNQRDAAAYLIKTGRNLLNSNVPLSEFISRSDNNKNFEYGWELIYMGRRVAMGYEIEDFTMATYRAHIRATRPGNQQ